MALASGTKLGPYEILSPLGAGGMGEVYRARDTRLERDVAIKVLRQHLSSNPDLKARFEREARAISSLNHPHICHLYDIGSQDGTDYLVMELLEGESLAMRLQKGALPLKQVLEYGIEIAEALEKAHKNGIVHRDLKPGNIMLTKSGAKLLDFGLAKPAPSITAASSSMETMSEPLTAEGMIVGTFQYMAPEQLEGKEADARTDIFALGEVLYEMASGQPPFGGKTQTSVIASILASEPKPLNEVSPTSPPALDHLIRTCLAKDPDDRWQSAADLARELQWIASGESTAAAAIPLRHRGGSRRLLRGLAVLVSIAVLAAGAGYFLRPTPESRVLRFNVYPPENVNFSPNYAISPDGKKLAAIGLDGHAHKIYMQPLDSLRMEALSGTDDAGDLFWSPDSRSLGFFTPNGLKTINLSTGNVEELANTDALAGAWSRNGTILFAPNGPTPLYGISSNGGAAAPATQLDVSRQELFHDFPQFLPDGEHFLFFVRSRKKENTGICVGRLGSKEIRFLLQSDFSAHYSPPGYLLFSRGRTLVAQKFDVHGFQLSGEMFSIVYDLPNRYTLKNFSASAHGEIAYASQLPQQHLEWVDRSGRSLGQAGNEGSYYWFDLSPDQKRVAIEKIGISVEPDIWIMDLKRNVASRFTFAGGLEPLWSPDGERVAYTSIGGLELMEKEVSGTQKEKTLLHSSVQLNVDSWSPDGRMLLYDTEDVSGHSQLWVLPLTGERKPYQLSRGTPAERQGRFSPDGKWIAYTSNESGREEIYLQPFPTTGAKWQISTQGGTSAKWSHDGKEIFYVDRELHLVAVPVEMRPAVRLGAAKALFQVRAPAIVFGSVLINLQYDVSPDERRFLVNPQPEGSIKAPLTVIVNWPAELKK